MVKKIEADERLPSASLAQSLAIALAIPAEHQHLFIEAARGQRLIEDLAVINGTVLPGRSPQPQASQIGESQLPVAATQFIGRVRELATISEQLRRPEVRLVTLFGAGGIGKTRLALAAARATEEQFAEGAIFVPLVGVNDPDQIPLAIFQAMRLTLVGNDLPLLQLQRVLRHRQILLVLDNFEQLTSGAAILSQLLAAAPDLSLLVTSRERLNLAEEWLFPLPEMVEAPSLFRQAARQVKPDFVAEQEECAIRRICQLVGNHPLAVELAASWTRFMSCSQIAAHIEQDLDFLGPGPRNAPERHRSLRALFAHSWQLLSPAEQAALPRLAVFRGGFAPEQAAQVAGATWPLLLGLVDKSLVTTLGNNRFDLHELTRQYMTEFLLSSAELPAAQQAHFAAYATLARELHSWFTSRESAANFQRCNQDHENIRTALRWGLVNGAIEAVREFVHHLFVFWLRGGYWQEAEYWMRQAAANGPQEDSAYLCLALAQQGVFAALQGRFSEANPKTERAYQMARRLEEPWPLAVTLQIQGQSRRDRESALAAFTEAIAICEARLDEPRFNAFLGSLLALYGDRLMGFGMLSEAKANLEASLAHLRALGDTYYFAYPLGNLGRMALHDGELAEAYEMIQESVAITRSSGNRGGIADWLFRLGQVQLFRGNFAEAQANLEETLRLYEETDNAFGPPGVLSNLALVAMEQGDLTRARSYIQASFSRYQQLRAEVQKIDFTADFLDFGDTLDSLLHAGLVAQAAGDWRTALACFALFERNLRSYVAMQPLQAKVAAARAAIQGAVSPSDYSAALSEAQQVTLADLLSRPW